MQVSGLLTLILKDSLNGSAVQHLTNMYLTSSMGITMLLRNCGPLLRNRKQDHVGIGPLEYKGSTVNDSLSKANVLAKYFSSVFTNEDTAIVPVLEGDPLPEISHIHIHADGVTQLLPNLKVHKAAGLDNIPSYFLKEVANEIVPALSLIFQASLNQGTLPDIWKFALVVPMYKKGNKKDPGNYYPVSLTCICSKIMEHIIYSCLFDHLNHFQVL